jgi:WD40 repeat protein
MGLTFHRNDTIVKINFNCVYKYSEIFGRVTLEIKFNISQMGTGMTRATDACMGPEEPINDALYPQPTPWVHHVVQTRDISPIISLGH